MSWIRKPNLPFEPSGERNDFLTCVRNTESAGRSGYKWKVRFLQQGLEGLHDRSRQPKSSPMELSENMVCRIVALKQAHPKWGPRKLRVVM